MYTNLIRGFRDRLDRYADPSQEIIIRMAVSGQVVYDCTCFGLDAQGKLSDENFMIFYNQPQSPGGEIRHSMCGSTAVFQLRLTRLPPSICRLVFTVSIDGPGCMGDILAHTLTLEQSGQTFASLSLSGKDFRNEKAIISVEIYRKDLWRFSAVCSGFNGGLGDLLRSFGGIEETSPPVPQAAPKTAPSPSVPARRQPSPAPSAPQKPKKVSLEKKLRQGAPHLVSLAKPLQTELKKQHLEDVVASVLLVLDISGSMGHQYQDGTVQEIVNKTLPLAVQFDDDGKLDFWYYGSRCRRMAPVTMSNCRQAVPEKWMSLMHSLGYGNNEPAVMKEIIALYKGSKLPVYVLFITDGGIYLEREIRKLLTEASHYPVFWQFVGVGGKNYGILERLDTMKDRFVDNASFFALDDFRKVSNASLYRRLLQEFPLWLEKIHALGMI